MRTVCLDGITSQYLIDSGKSKRMPLACYQPGGSRFTDADALRSYIGDELGLHMLLDGKISVYGNTLTIPTDSEGPSLQKLRALFDTEIVYKGRTFVLNGFSAEAEAEWSLGDTAPGISRWMEFSFEVKAA
jgi:hypothetical protein